MINKRSIFAAGAAGLALAAAGCGGSSSSGGTQGSKPVDPNAKEVSPAGDIPDNQAYVAYAPRGGGYSVKVPEGWSRTVAGGAVTFTDKLNAVRMESFPVRPPPTPAEAGRTEVAKLRHTINGFRPGAVTLVTRKAGSAVRITYLADGRPDSVTGKARKEAIERYLFLHKSREVVLTLSGPKGADNVDPWRIITDSLRWTQ